jgi:hypothetical protein
MLTEGVYDTLWLTLIILGVGGLTLALSLMIKLKSDRIDRRRRWGRDRGQDQVAHEL